MGILCLSDKYNVDSLKELCVGYMVDNSRSPKVNYQLTVIRKETQFLLQLRSFEKVKHFLSHLHLCTVCSYASLFVIDFIESRWTKIHILGSIMAKVHQIYDMRMYLSGISLTLMVSVIGQRPRLPGKHAAAV